MDGNSKHKQRGKRIREVRNKLGFSQEKFGQELGGLSKSSISEYESGDIDPSFETIIKMADLGKVSLDWLILGREYDLEKLEPDFDPDLDFLLKTWPRIPAEGRRQMLEQAQHFGEFPYMKEVERFEPHSKERADFIQSRVYAEFDIEWFSFENTKGRGEYLNGIFSDSEFYMVTRQEVQRMIDLFRNKSRGKLE